MIHVTKEKGISRFSFEIIGELTEEQTHRMRESMETIISQGVLSIHDGKAILSFDYEGTLREISFDFKKWRKQKSA